MMDGTHRTGGSEKSGAMANGELVFNDGEGRVKDTLVFVGGG